MFGKSRRVERSTRVVLEKAAMIPGMIEPGEQELLYKLARNTKLNENSCFVEFGSFLGRSSFCLAAGIRDSGFRSVSLEAPVLRCYDSFACSKSGSFYPHLMQALEGAGIDSGVKATDDRVDFREVFMNFMSDFSDGDFLSVQAEIEEMRPLDGSEISLVHFDLPKWYPEYRTILENFSSHFSTDAILVYQDYFFHWSATLIAAVYYWISNGILEPVDTAASTMSARLTRPISSSDLEELDAFMSSESVEGAIIESAEYFANFKMDRPEIFNLRQYLAAIQYLVEGGRHKQAQKIYDEIFCQKKKLKKQVFMDFSDLVGSGFSLRSLYELDHSA